MKNKMKLLGVALLTTLAFTSCSSDDDSPTIVTGNGGTPVTVETKLFATSNTTGNITSYNLTDLNNIAAKTYLTTTTDADGVFYDADADVAYQASRSGGSLEGFTNIEANSNMANISVDITGTADMTSPREVTVNGNFVVVADNADVDMNTATDDGRFFIYERSGATFTLRNIVTVNFAVWSGVFIGDDFYAIVDKTNQLAVFEDFLTTNTMDATVSATKTISVEGIVRTHGITYDAGSNTMVLTDIGDAGVATDGGFHVISNFLSKFNGVADGGTLVVAGNQVRVSGSSTLLGNPVDVAYDGTNGIVIVAERANQKVLAFSNIGTGGNLTPIINNDLSGVSSVFLSID